MFFIDTDTNIWKGGGLGIMLIVIHLLFYYYCQQKGILCIIVLCSLELE